MQHSKNSHKYSDKDKLNELTQNVPIQFSQVLIISPKIYWFRRISVYVYK